MRRPSGDQLPIINLTDRVEMHLNRGGLAILAVPSLRYAKGGHWIVAEGHQLFDPAPGEGDTYRSLEDSDAASPLHIIEAFLIE